MRLEVDQELPQSVAPASPTRKRKKTTAQKRTAMEVERKKLFETGSEFKSVQRADIVGIDNVLDQIDIVIHWLKNYKIYFKYDARLASRTSAT